ncbi:thiamine phosphate synthase [Bacteroides sp. 519]|uniref:thiamine phosphate synthase n=1 Tax=Bacteroides sp. 519 TaxID=2302937 RepID=UPI0013D24D0F|nr:thiamine phosphate synthase [Bacteroides sp. 519]NDV59685.1 thiamine phosphate synthase [Bacteroides sp. 519]
MKLIVITAPYFFVEEDKIITLLFEEGLDILHLRKPETSAMYSERLLTLIPEKYHKRIVTHEHFYLKEEYNLMGIHLNMRNPKEPHDYAGHVSCSCRSIEELRKKKHFYDYVFLKGIYDSDPSSNNFMNFSAEELRKVVKEGYIDTDVMAFGGISPENIHEVKDIGFGGAVIMNDLWEKFDVCNDKDFGGIIKHFKILKEMAE